MGMIGISIGFSKAGGGSPYLFQEEFSGGSQRLMAWGNDTGWNAGLDPVSRRIYRFAMDISSVTVNDTQWMNVDTGNVGFFHPPLTDLRNSSTVVYHPGKLLFYIYGGRNGATKYNDIYSFNPATLVFTKLTETLPTAVAGATACYDPTSGNVFIFGGWITAESLIDTIAVHDPTAGTCTDTTADLP
ncbi:MAG: kelch repeat-containing protein, partial [Candidatus Promineifilaceae bacterium]